jgi:hypothetical protein
MTRNVAVIVALVSIVSCGATTLFVSAQESPVKSEPIIGSWRLNVARSTFPRKDVPSPKEQTENYREDSGRIHLTIARTMSDGSSDPRRLSWPAVGGVTSVHEGRPLAEGQSTVEALLAPGDWYVIYMRNGQQYLTMHKVVSKDGKTMRQTMKGLAQGKPYEQVQVFDRQ